MNIRRKIRKTIRNIKWDAETRFDVYRFRFALWRCKRFGHKWEGMEVTYPEDGGYCDSCSRCGIEINGFW